jgi:hypothetical protein
MSLKSGMRTDFQAKIQYTIFQYTLLGAKYAPIFNKLSQ